MNPINPQDKYPDVAEVYFTDGVNLSPSVAMKDVGGELPSLILAAFAELKRQELWPPTLGVATAALTYQAVATGNHVSVNAPPNAGNFGLQLGWIYRRENAVGGIGVVIVNLMDATVTTYGGRGFPEIVGSAPYFACSFPLDDLEKAPLFGEVPAPPVNARPAKNAKKKAAKKKAAKRKAKPADSEEVRV
jgi:hypothetical protein